MAGLVRPFHSRPKSFLVLNIQADRRNGVNDLEIRRPITRMLLAAAAVVGLSASGRPIDYHCGSR